MSQLTTNTTTIDEIIAIANNLPDAGTGGDAVETCTVMINLSADVLHEGIAYNDGTAWRIINALEDIPQTLTVAKLSAVIAILYSLSGDVSVEFPNSDVDVIPEDASDFCGGMLLFIPYSDTITLNASWKNPTGGMTI